MHSQWWQGQVNGEEYRDEVCLYRDGVKKAQVKPELNLETDAKSYMASTEVNQKMKVKEGVSPINKA